MLTLSHHQRERLDFFQWEVVRRIVVECVFQKNSISQSTPNINGFLHLLARDLPYKTDNSFTTMTRLILTTTLCAAMMASTADAFTVGPTRPSLYTPGVNTFGSVSNARKSSSSSSSALQMNLFDRFSRVAKSNLNNILQSLEDPEKIMTQALEDMQVRTHNCMLLTRTESCFARPCLCLRFPHALWPPFQSTLNPIPSKCIYC
jgi:hypothetical protein